MGQAKGDRGVEQPSGEIGRYLTVEQAAAYLALSKWTLYKLVDRRRIPFIPISAGESSRKPALRFDRLILDSWMARKLVEPI